MEGCSMKGERHPIILVRGMKVGEEGFVDHKKYTWVEFHKVDLEGRHVDKNCYPKLLTWSGIGDILHAKADQKMYVMGGLAESQCAVDGDYQCGYVLDINKDKDDCTWKQFTLPINYRYSRPRCAILDGKLYHFEFPDCELPLDPGPLEIVLFPPKLAAGGSMSLGMISDPCNNRILMNLFGGILYAYYPRDSVFELVGKVYPWSDVVALADNVVYVYCEDNSLCAYDLSDMAKPLDVVWTPGVGFKFAFLEYDALFHVGNNNFWFAIWSPDFEHNIATLYFVKFKVQREGDKIICTPLALQKYLLESTCSVLDFHLLDEEACG